MNKEEILHKYSDKIYFDQPIPYIAENKEQEYKELKIKIQELEYLVKMNNVEDKQINKILQNLKIELESLILYIAPFKIKDFFSFGAIECLQVKKDLIPNAKIITMKYLDFLLYSDEKINNIKYLSELITILKICCNINPINIDYKIDNKGHSVLILNNIEYTWKDFDNIRSIINYQNISNYNERYIDPKLQAVIDEARAFKNKGKKTATLEELMSCIVVSTGYKYEEIYNMSIRKFYITLERASYKLDWQLLKAGIYNGTIKETEIPYWQETLSKEDDFSDVVSDFDKFSNKINKSNTNNISRRNNKK
ncbi:hypothetical protein [Clostridium sp.]|uniref:hypothetical protein n=1 Tax=Clostridium sp. TaxID=1506 RepID=UPI002614D61D|nr:hypothetical protein [Clostridium sp.]